MKTCTKCKQEKELSEFYKRKAGKDGLNSRCKPCVDNVSKAWIKRNPEKYNQFQSEYRENNRETLNANARAKYHENPEKHRQLTQEYREKHPEQCKANLKKWRSENRDKINATRPRYKGTIKKWVENNRPRLRSLDAKRRALKLCATPKWLTLEQLEEIETIYKSAKERETFHEDSFEVDHIEPLQGKTSCGLHVPWNLQVLPKTENRKKSNKLLNNLKT